MNVESDPNSTKELMYDQGATGHGDKLFKDEIVPEGTPTTNMTKEDVLKKDLKMLKES